MRTIVFVGPTLLAEEVQRVLPCAEVAGPVACGDVLRAASQGPAVMGIVDGLFEHRLPVWHKEILWALSRGCRIYGAASMGALRASELEPFGMVGVGVIFEWFRDGVLEDDDEVAIAHEEGAREHQARSDAMVNVRATLAAALQAGVLEAAAAAPLLAALKAAPYPQRSLRRAVADSDLAGTVRAGLLDWLERGGFVDQKQIDARAMLVRMARDAIVPPPAAVEFQFSYTEVFHALVRSAAPLAQPSSAGESAGDEPSFELEEILEELRLRGLEVYQSVRLAAAERALAQNLRRVGQGGGFDEVVLGELPAVLQERGLLESLARRARAKSELLAGDERPSVRMAREVLLADHFAALGRPVPHDLENHARALGLADASDLVMAIARERWFVARGAAPPRTSTGGSPE